ncbi:MAG: PQQ-dependent sugar dehydrogenase [Anaerolineae bacterium]
MAASSQTAQDGNPPITLTPVSNFGAPAAFVNAPAPIMPANGWSCEDFPCADDLDGWQQRIGVPDGYHVEHVGRFPGQVHQIAYGPDGRLYATVLENGTLSGAVYAMGADAVPIRVSDTIFMPLGLAFQPGTDTLFVSGRVSSHEGGIFRVSPDGTTSLWLSQLPCCLSPVENQPNGLTFGPDGYLYVGIGSLSDTTATAPGSIQAYVTLTPSEATVLRIHPQTGEAEVYANGIRNPYDLSFDEGGRLYVTDTGVFNGEGDRLIRAARGGSYGFPYYRPRGCEECPLTPGNQNFLPELWDFPSLTQPRGVTVYLGSAYPTNLFGSVFVALWNGIDGGQRIVRIDPDAIPEGAANPMAGATVPPWATITPEPPPAPEAFVTGLIRPIDVIVSPEGMLVVADYVYGHVWRIVYG